MTAGPPLPKDSRLRSIAEAIERNGASGELLDHRWRIVFITSELCRMLGIAPEDAGRFYGLSPITRNRKHADTWGTDDESGSRWWDKVAPTILHDVPAEDPDFAEVFGGCSKQLIERLTAEDAAELEIDPDGLGYLPLGELGASEKAIRDAGSIAVAEL